MAEENEADSADEDEVDSPSGESEADSVDEDEADSIIFLRLKFLRDGYFTKQMKLWLFCKSHSLSTISKLAKVRLIKAGLNLIPTNYKDRM